MLKVLLRCLVLCISVLIRATEDQFILMTMLYHEQNVRRIEEYITCLNYNLEHPQIKKIYIFFDIAGKHTSSKIHDYLINLPVDIEYINGRITFQQAFERANQLFPEKKVILANADIYFNETLCNIHKLELTPKTLIALTRWNVRKNGILQIGGFPEAVNFTSQDVWIFKTPFYFRDSNFLMGVFGCDAALTYCAKKESIYLINPCLSVQACHLHLSNVRHYDNLEYSSKMGHGNIPWSMIDNINLLKGDDLVRYNLLTKSNQRRMR